MKLSYKIAKWLWSMFPDSERGWISREEIVARGGRVLYPARHEGAPTQCLIIPMRCVTVTIDGESEPFNLQPLDVIQLSTKPEDRVVRLQIQGERSH